jgi:hypothetical protein
LPCGGLFFYFHDLYPKQILMKKVFSFSRIVATLCCLVCAATLSAQFTAGNIVVMQAGDGAATLTNTGNPIILKEFSPSGTLTFSMAVPSTGTNALLISGSATSEGVLSGSPDRKILSFGGYATQLPNSTALPGSTASSINRGIGAVNAAGVYSVAATSTSFYSANNIRGATNDGAGNYWASGSGQGTDYFGTTTAPAVVQNVKTNTRGIAIFNGQLFFSTQSSAGTQTNLGVYAVGSGTPVTAGQTVTNVINTGTGSQPEQFFFETAPTPSTCYIADSRAQGGGVQKWVLSAGSWSLAYTIPTSSTSTGAFGVIANFTGANPVVYATSVEGSNNRLIAINDIGSSATATTIATSGTNTSFRGLAFSPCNTPTVTQVVASGTACSNSTVQLIASASGSATSYQWYGPGVFSSTTAANPVVTSPVQGSYTVMATNACGASSSATVLVNVTQAPSVSALATSTSVCPGQAVTLTGSGASSYTWSSGISNGVAFTPSASNVYTVSGAGNNCTSTHTIAVNVNTFAITVNSAVVCPGQSVTLQASGANTYTWSTGGNTSSITVSPNVNTNYTVNGISSAGCFTTAQTQVNIATSPTVTVNSGSVCAGTPFTLTAGGANTYTWNTGAQTAVIAVTPAATSTYVVTGSLTGCPGVDAQTATVTVVPVPTISVAGGTVVCNNAPVILTASGATSYSWNVMAFTASIAVSPTAVTVYTVVGETGACANAKTHTVVPGGTSPTVSAAPANSSICEGETVKLTASGASSYMWNTGASGGVLSAAPATNTVYLVTGTNVSGCTASAQVTVNVNPCVGVTSQVASAILVYPSPVTEMMQISCDKRILGVDIFSVDGREVTAIKGSAVSMSIDVSGLRPGIYILRVRIVDQPEQALRVIKSAE